LFRKRFRQGRRCRLMAPVYRCAMPLAARVRKQACLLNIGSEIEVLPPFPKLPFSRRRVRPETAVRCTGFRRTGAPALETPAKRGSGRSHPCILRHLNSTANSDRSGSRKRGARDVHVRDRPSLTWTAFTGIYPCKSRSCSWTLADSFLIRGERVQLPGVRPPERNPDATGVDLTRNMLLLHESIPAAVRECRFCISLPRP
jgi:hypothetical protein